MRSSFIIATGSEFFCGEAETNSDYIAGRLMECGIKTVGKAVAGDDQSRIAAILRCALTQADIVVCSGGLGPTSDDLTREALAEVLGLPLELREEELDRIRAFFSARRIEMPPINEKQAIFPVGAEALPNSRGSAPGVYLGHKDKIIVLLPGPPREMKAMLEEQVLPRIKTVLDSSPCVASRTFKVMGLGESQVQTIIAPVFSDFPGLELSLLAREGEVYVKIREESGSTGESAGLETAAARISDLLGGHVFGGDADTLAGAVVRCLAERGLTVALAESCTGGLVAGMITDVAGSSRVFWGGAVTYSNEAKEKILGVRKSTLARAGAVSPETAGEMAEGIRRISSADYGVSLTGIAGPGGGTPEKPVGLVYMGLAGPFGTVTQELRLGGDREVIRIRAAKCALDGLRKAVIKDYEAFSGH